MSKDNSSLRLYPRNASKNSQSEGNENDFENLSDSINFPPSRTPLNTIPDPSQCQKELQELDHDSKDTFQGIRAVQSSEKRFDASDHQLIRSKRIENVGPNYDTPRVPGRGKSYSEPNSAQSTPARSVYRTTNIGALGACTGPRPPQYTGGKGGSSSRVSRGISIVNSEPQMEVPHFELVEDPSFWNDHNVQVLIRVRPISNKEKVSHGYGRSLRQESAQTLVWLGHPEMRFTFDHIACETISQEKLFRVAGLPMVDDCMSGYNSCMFAYGQTGSGKTYTMMGEIGRQMDGKLNQDCGITPRIFEYLFTRIKEEEEKRRDERLKYSCKCSFLEIYNEQITDLLEPSSANLQLREDLKKGVYVENLMEYNVRTVNDVLTLLLQGAANRKMAATHMNSESSRSHSVFTCIIESHWEKDSMTHLRFGRLNLVDLAGSERQKSSGAEGDRLREAANINKSLSTLGLVIMSLVDLAHGKHRHIPYRDSRLTFLLQDSLGGNSKTTIIANVSPSLCSANETLSTLKFAQRAKLIQNNAKVNEDASGDVTALQRQIQQLKDQLSFLMKHHNTSRSLSHFVPSFQLGDLSERDDSSAESNMSDDHNIPIGQKTKMKCLEATIVGALRREKLAETAVRTLEAEIEQMNRLASQRDEDVQRTKMMLRFREEKHKRLELLADGLVSADKYLIDENNALIEEIQLLRARIDRNPELTRFALENIRLLEQLRLFQDFYEEGERETLLAEVSELRDQLLETLEVQENYGQRKFPSRREKQDKNALKELEECRNMNCKLIREVDELQSELRKYMNCNKDSFDPVTDYLSKDPKELKEIAENSSVETITLRDSKDEMASSNQPEDEVQQNKSDQKMGDVLVLQCGDTLKELMDARFLMEAMESEQVSLIEELQFVREENHRLMEILSNEDKVQRHAVLKLDNHCTESRGLGNQNLTLLTEGSKDNGTMDFQVKLDRMTKDLEEARLLSSQYLENHASQLSRDHQSELIREEVEMETTKTILHLQEDVAALQSELQERLRSTAEENQRLRNTVAAKEDEIRALHAEWEGASLELTSFLLDGSKSLRDASGQIESIICSFPRVNVWIGEHVEKAAKVFVEKEETILLLQKSLEDAQKTVLQMEQKLNSLKGATMALTEVLQLENDASTKEATQLTTILDDKLNMIEFFENELMSREEQITEAEKRANDAFLVVTRLSDHPKAILTDNVEGDSSKTKSHQIYKMKAYANALALEDLEIQVEFTRLGLMETENAFNVSCADVEMYLSTLQTDIHKEVPLYRELVHDLVTDIHEMRKNFVEFKENHRNVQIHTLEIPSQEAQKFPKCENQQQMLRQVTDELAETNNRLNTIRACVNTIPNIYDSPVIAEDLVEVDRRTAGFSTPCCNLSAEIAGSEKRLDESLSSCWNRSPGKVTDQTLDLGFNGGSIFPSDNQESDKSERLIKKLSGYETTLLGLRKEFRMAYDALIKLNIQLASLFNEKEIGDQSHAKGVGFPESLDIVNNKEKILFKDGLNQFIMPEMSQVLRTSALVMQEAGAGCCNTRKFVADEKVIQGSSFFSKFEEARATMKEADFMLNELLKANDNAKQLTGMWKQAVEDLMVEKASLMEEIKQLRSSIQLRDGENEILQDQIHYSLTEVVKSMSVLEGSFLHMQSEVEEMCKTAYFDTLTMAQDILHYICFSRSSLEDICAEIMEKGFASFVLHQCHVGEYFHKLRSFNVDPGLRPSRLQQGLMNHVRQCLTSENDTMVKAVRRKEGRDQTAVVKRLEVGELGVAHDDQINENLELKKELERKEVLLKGLLFDFSLLQESTSTKKDIKDEIENLFAALSPVRHELQMKTNQLDDMLVEHRKLEVRLADTETSLFAANSDLEQAKGTLDILTDQNAELRVLLKDLYLKKSETEEKLEEQREVSRSLEKEILRRTSSADIQLLMKDTEDDLRRVTGERDEVHKQVRSLQDGLDMAYALADENEAIAVEARQESEASKIYAEQKEEEVKILERSVEELECTINVLEKKVYEMEYEVERHRMIRDSLELELQELRQRLLTVENFTENRDSENLHSDQFNEDQHSRKLHNRSLEHYEAHKRIRVLEEERAEQTKQIKQCKEYITELVLHAEAQASQYQQKYKTLEAMVGEVKTDSSNLASEAPTLDKTEKISMRTRGSSSPFRCISTFVQQINLEKDEELSIARHRMKEIEALAASRQKEVCLLNTRLAAAESMTHDVIRDLLGVKLDMTNYANLIDQYQLQKLVEAAQQQTEESIAMDQEILNLRRQINDLTEERERCILEVNIREADILTVRMTVEQLQERVQLLTAQNEMLQMDKTNLQRRVVELDDMIKKLFGTQNTQPRIQQQINSLVRSGNSDVSKRLAHSGKLLLRVNDELAQYCRSDGSHPHDKLDERSIETKFRKQKTRLG